MKLIRSCSKLSGSNLSGSKLSFRIGASALAFGLCLLAAPRPTQADGPERFLFVWAGDQARQAPDFLAVVDFDETSAAYGKGVSTVPLPTPCATGNEPHPCGLSRAGQVAEC